MSSIVTIDDRFYYMDRGQFARSKAKDFRNESDTGERTPEERSVVANEVWLRVWNDLSLGAGQELADDQESSARRFRQSYNLDPFTRGEVQLTRMAKNYFLPEALNTFSPVMADDGDRILLCFQDEFYPSAFWGNYRLGFNPVNVDATGPFSTLDITNYNGKFIAVTIQGVHSISNGVSAFEASETYYTIEYCCGRLIAAYGNTVFELDSDFAPTVVYSHPNPDWVWFGFTESSKGFYGWGWGSPNPLVGMADYQEPTVFFFSVEEFDGEVAVPYKVLPLPAGERVLDLLFYGGYVILTTNMGVRMAQVNELGYLVYGPLLEIPHPHGIYGRGENIYVGFAGYEYGYGVDSTNDVNTFWGIAVIKLRELVDVLTPPYAMLYAISGNPQYLNAPTNIAMDKEDVIFFGSYDDGIYFVDPAQYSPTAGMRFGFCNFSTNEHCRIFEVGLEAQTEIPNKVKYDVGIRYLNNDSEDASGFAWRATKIIDETQGSVVSHYKNCDVHTIRAELAVELEVRDPPNIKYASRLYQTQFSASPMSFYSEILILPLLFASWVRNDYGLDVSLDLDTEWNILANLMNTKKIVTLKIADAEFRGFIQSMEMKQGTLTEISPFINQDFATEGELCGMVFLTFHTLRNTP